MDVYLATLGGLAKEPQNQEAKAAMRAEIWKLLRSSTEGNFMQALKYDFAHII
jgi:hypothetical protein